MVRIVPLNLDKDKHIFIPGHKQWIQLYKQEPKPMYPIVDDEVVIPKSFEYEMKEITFNPVWEGEKEIVEGEEVGVSVEKYLSENFDIIWSNN